MPRIRKPQTSGVQRVWTGRVASTTTGSTTTQAVYRIPTWNRRNCDVRNFEVIGVSPVEVAIEWENIYRISLDPDALRGVIENYDNLDLSNTAVTLSTVDWPVTINWNLNVEDWTFTANEISTEVFTATSWNITTLTSSDLTATNVSATDVSTWTLEVSGNTTIDWTLWVAWATVINNTLTVSWNISWWANLSIVGDSTISWSETVTWWITWASITAPVGNIPNLTSTTITTWAITANQWATVHQWLTVTEWATVDSLNNTGNTQLWGTLAVTWASTFTGDVNTNNLYSSWTASMNDVAIAWNETVTWTSTVNWATLLNSTLTVVGTTTMWSNASVAGNLNVAWNTSTTWTLSAGWDTTLGWKLTVTDVATFNNDVVVNDDLTVTWTSHLAWVETTWSVDVTGTIRTTWAINAGNWVYVTWQVESDSVVTTNTTTDNLTVNGNFVLGSDATAWDFVLQSEKWEANGVVPLNANGKVDEQYLPEVFTTCKAKVVQWVFNNSNTAVVVDEDITADAFVKTSNYQDIVWDLSEVISVGQITVTSNTAETGSFKVLIVKPVL